MTIQSIPEWTACRQIASWPNQFHEAEKIFKAASPTQFDELIGIAETGGLADQHVALSVLEHFARAKYDLRWNLERRDCLIRTLRQLVIEKYPQAIGRQIRLLPSLIKSSTGYSDLAASTMVLCLLCSSPPGLLSVTSESHFLAFVSR